MLTCHSSRNTSLLFIVSALLTRELCREACQDLDNFNRLASSLVDIALLLIRRTSIWVHGGAEHSKLTKVGDPVVRSLLRYPSCSYILYCVCSYSYIFYFFLSSSSPLSFFGYMTNKYPFATRALFLVQFISFCNWTFLAFWKVWMWDF
jgi:hypothetical protein